MHLTVKTTKIQGIVRECQFENGLATLNATEIVGFIPKWAFAVCQPSWLDNTLVGVSMAHSDDLFTFQLMNKTDYTGVIWITALLVCNIN